MAVSAADLLRILATVKVAVEELEAAIAQAKLDEERTAEGRGAAPRLGRIR